LGWCCLQCCVIGDSNTLEFKQLIKLHNQMDYLLVILDFHDYLPSQTI
jgi:hypothetical protein